MKYQVWYHKDYGSVYPESIVLSDLEASHAMIAVVEAEDPEEVFFKMQGEVWSPNGEARPLIKALGLRHTTMSVGDVVVDAEGVAHAVDLCGFYRLGAASPYLEPFKPVV